MSDLPADPQTTYFDTKEAAAKLRMSASTLQKWRHYGCGPNFHKFGKSVRYSEADLRAWGTSKNLAPTEPWMRELADGIGAKGK